MDESVQVPYTVRMTLIEQNASRYLRAPEWHPGSQGVSLRTIGWFPDEGIEREVRFDVDAIGGVSGEHLGEACDAIVWLDSHGPIRTVAERDLEAVAAEHHLRVVHDAGVVSVLLDQPSGEVCVWSAIGSASAPALASVEGGCWVAWHHDVREDTRQADVAKWICVRFVSDEGQVLEPTAPMTDRDRDLGGEEQSFEFPRLVVGSNGALSIFGRGSHNFWRQDLDDSGFSPREALGQGEWGSRGRWCAVCRVDERILSARRERKGILVESYAAPKGAAPSLAPADIDWTSGGVEVAARAKRQRVRRRRDPARTHGLNTYFGDIQQHSAHSDGLGSADEVYVRARDRYEDDFVALTDHESFLGKRTGPGEWEYLKQVADRHSHPGRFATLLAYEWTGTMYPGPGHKCMFVARRDDPIISRDELPEGRDAVAAISAMGGMASPHHIGWTGCDEPGHDPKGQPTWEICSCHGCYEHADHPLGARGEHTHQLIDVMLKRGHRFGFTASSDSHGLLWHHGESRKRDPYRTGLTAVQAPSLTRHAVFAALKTSRCYATSGAKILLDITVNGAPMGSTLSASGNVVVRSRVVGTEAIARVEWIGPEGVLTEGRADGEFAFLETRMPLPAYAYLRVVQEDGEMAWSSPVFNDAATPIAETA